MRTRGIDRADIEYALRHAHTTYDDTRNESIIYLGPGRDGRDLKVVTLPPGLVDEETTITVKTVAWRD